MRPCISLVVLLLIAASAGAAPEQVTGTVTGPDGEPLAGVVVRVTPVRSAADPNVSAGDTAGTWFLDAIPTTWIPIGETAVTKTDAEGRFTVPAAHARSHQVVVEAPDGLVVPWSHVWPGYDLALSALPARVLRGRVVDSSGDGVVGRVLLQVPRQPGRVGYERGTVVVAAPMTDADGAFVAIVPKDRRLFADVSVRGRCLHEWIEVREAATPVIRLPGGTASVAGRVVDAEGRPIAEARVAVHVRLGPMQTHFPREVTGLGVTDTSGRYAVTGLPARARLRAVRVEAEGFVPAAQELDRAGMPLDVRASRVVDFVLERGGTVVGRIVDQAGVPVAGAEVYARRSDPSRRVPRPHLWHPVSWATTDAGGAFRLEHVPPGPTALEVRGDGVVAPMRAWKRFDVLPGETHQADHSVERSTPEPEPAPAPLPSRISGRVVRADGSPVPAVAIVWSNRHGLHTKADGSFSLTTRVTGPFEVGVGVAPEVSRSLDLSAGDIVEGVKLVLPELRTARISVVDDAGDPLPSVRVAAGSDLFNAHATGLTDPDGVAVVRNVPDGPVSVFVNSVRVVELGAEETAARVGLPAPTPRIEGFVRGPQGLPVAYGRVTVLRPDIHAAGEVVAGHFCLPLHGDVPAAVELGVSFLRDMWGDRENLLPSIQSVPTDGTLTMIPLERGLRVAGRVLDQDGKPVPGAGVRGWSLERSRSQWQGPHDVFRTAEDGTFAVVGLAPGPAQVTATPPSDLWFPPNSIDVAAGTEGVVLRLRRGAAIEGVVATPDGSPLPGVRVECGSRSAQTDAKGAFRCAPLPLDEQVDVAAEAQGAAGARYLIATVDGVQPGGAPLHITLEKAVAITGRVTGPDGEPVADVKVACSPWFGDDATLPQAQATTDASGAFELSPLRPGRYRVEWTTRGDFRPIEATAVDAPATLDRQLEPGLRIRGRITGASVRYGQIEFRTPGDDPAARPRARVDEDGTFEIRLDNVVDGTDVEGTLYAYDGRHGAVLEGVRPSEGPFELRWEPLREVHGSIVDLPSLHMGRIRLVLVRGTLRYAAAPDRRGEFRFRAVAPGTYVLTIEAPRLRGTFDGPVEVVAGDEEVVLRYVAPTEDGG